MSMCGVFGGLLYTRVLCFLAELALDEMNVMNSIHAGDYGPGFMMYMFSVTFQNVIATIAIHKIDESD